MDHHLRCEASHNFKTLIELGLLVGDSDKEMSSNSGISCKESVLG